MKIYDYMDVNSEIERIDIGLKLFISKMTVNQVVQK